MQLSAGKFKGKTMELCQGHCEALRGVEGIMSRTLRSAVGQEPCAPPGGAGRKKGSKEERVSMQTREFLGGRFLCRVFPSLAHVFHVSLGAVWHGLGSQERALEV